MSEYFDYNQKPQRKTWVAFLAVAVVFAVLGGLIVLAVMPKAQSASESLTTPVPSAQDSAAPAASASVLVPVPSERTISLTTAMPNIGSYYNPVPDVAERLTPSVVSILNYQTSSFSSYYGNPWGGGGRNAQPREQLVGSGSGVIVTEDGYIVTNNHVVDQASRLEVKLPGGDTVEAKLIGTDSRSDLAVIKIEKRGLPVAVLGDSDKIRVGEMAIAIGNPLGDELASTVTVGYVSGINREIQDEGRTFYMLQTDAAINKGNSGGALLNDRGEVIGINTMKSGGVDYDGTTIEGIGFAIPSNVVRSVVDELIDKGYVSRAGIGITGQDVGDLAETYNVPKGIVVREVTGGGPAEKAGVKQYDIITMIDSQKIDVFEDLINYLNTKKVGDQVTLTIYRDDKNTDMKLTLTLTDISKLETEQSGEGAAPAQTTPAPRRVWPPSGN